MGLLTHLHKFDFTALDAKDSRLLPLAVRGYGPTSLTKKIKDILNANQFKNISDDPEREEIYAIKDIVEYNFILHYDQEHSYYLISVSTYAKKKGKTFKALLAILDILRKEFKNELAEL